MIMLKIEAVIVNGSLGCYVDDSSLHDLNGYSFSSNYMTILLCVFTCYSKGFQYAGVQNRYALVVELVLKLSLQIKFN